MRCGHVRNLKLACLHSFIRKFAPTKISRYTVTQVARNTWKSPTYTSTAGFCLKLHFQHDGMQLQHLECVLVNM